MDERELARAQIERELGRRTFWRYVQLCWREVEPDPLVTNWHMEAMCEFLEALYRLEFQEGLIIVPPGMSKSLIVSTFFPSWCWVQNPAIRTIFATYAQSLSEKNAKLHRDLVAGEWHSTRWPEASIGREESKKVKFFANVGKGWRFSTSVGGEVTGRHGDILGFDDLVKAQDAQGRAAIDPQKIKKANDFWFKTMATRQANARTTRKIGIMQRLHHEDTAGQCLERGYESLILPMEYDPRRHCVVPSIGFEDPRKEAGELLDPQRFPLEAVQTLKDSLGGAAESQLQQNPSPLDGDIFKKAWFKTYKGDPPSGTRTIIVVDCSFKDTKGSDFVSIQVWRTVGQNFYKLDRWHGRADVLETIEQILLMRGKYPRAGIYVEDKANGPAVVQTLQGKVQGILEWSPGTDSKESRAYAVQPVVKGGNVYVPEDAPWLEDYLGELTKFPMSLYDDQVDGTTMALLILWKPQVRNYLEALKKARPK